jgi:excisionase family DNA binding protein
MDVTSDRLLTVAEAAELLGTSERFPRRLIADRRIRFVRIGRLVRIPETALREFIAAGVVGAGPGASEVGPTLRALPALTTWCAIGDPGLSG